MAAWNLIYLIFVLVIFTYARGVHIPAVMACESMEAIRGVRREIIILAWVFGGFALSMLEPLYHAQSLAAFVVAAAAAAVATRTALDYVQLLHWVDRVCREGPDMRRSGAAPPLF